MADLLEVSQRFLLDRREAAFDVALGRLRVGQVVRLVCLDDLVLVGLPDAVPLLPISAVAARLWARCSAPVISEVSPNTP